METVGRIRRAHFVQGKGIKEIVRELRVSRNTVRRVLRSGETQFTYEREVQPRPKLGPWTAELDRLLAENEARPRRDRLDLVRLFEDLRGRGYAGSYDAARKSLAASGTLPSTSMAVQRGATLPPYGG